MTETETASLRAGDRTRVTSRVFTAPRWPLTTSDRTHTGDVTALSGLSLVNTNNTNTKERKKESTQAIAADLNYLPACKNFAFRYM